MRQRRNISGIEKIYKVPSKCDYCGMNFCVGENVGVEPNIEKSTCDGCSETTPIGEWISHIYSIKSEFNEFVNIRNLDNFENFIGEKIL